MAVNVIQPSFSSGEFSPELYSRVDLQKYSTGLKTCRNMIIHPTGGLSNRPGTKYIAEAKYTNYNTRLVSFEFSVTQAYIIEFGHGYCRFYMNGGQIQKSSPSSWVTSTSYYIGDFVTESSTTYYCIVDHSSGTFATDLAAGKWVAQSCYEIPTDYDSEDIFKLKFTQSADVLYIVHPDYPPAQLERYDHDHWELVDYEFEEGPFRLSNSDDTSTLAVSATSGTSKTMTASLDVFNSGHVGSLWRLEHDIEGQALSLQYTTPTTSASIKCGGTWRIITHGTWTGKFTIQKSINDGSTWTSLRTYSSKDDFNVNTYGEEDDLDPFLIRIYCDTLSSGTLSIDLTSDPFTQTGVVEVTAYANTKSVTVNVLRTLGLTSATTNWAEGAWSDYRGWPATITFYQDRLAFASNEAEPQTIWFTEAGNYTSFLRSSPLEDTDGITINLPARKMNGIRNLVGLSKLLALTSASEWSIGADGALTPTSISAQVEGYRGCNEKIDPIIIGNRIIYVQRMGSKLRDLGYDFGVNGFTGDILNNFSSHLLEGYTVVDMDYQEEPDNLVWLVRDDGILLSLTYLREQDVLGWGWHDTEGKFKSVATIPGDGYHEVWVIVERDSKVFIEQMYLRSESTNPRKQYFLDCCISYDTPKLITAITSADPGVITSTSHGLNDGDYVDIYEVLGMTDLNENRYKVANATTHTFTLKDYDTDADIDTSAFDAYISGGEIYLVTDTVTGLDHLDGYDINILADGSVLKDKNTSAGEYIFNNEIGIAHFGFGYTSEIETLNLEMATSEGTIQGKQVQIPEVIFRFENSRGGWVGPDEDHLDELIQRTDEPLNSPTRLYTQEYTVALDAAYTSGARIIYKQVDPLPVKILALIPKGISIGG